MLVTRTLTLLIVIQFVSGFTSCRKEETPIVNRPNILLAIADDWGWPHAGTYGDRVVETPTFDRVASEGLLYTNAYVSSPSCTPSRAALLTGQWHWRLREGANLWSTLSRDIPVYPDLLESAGYHVGFSGKGWGPGRFEVGGRERNPAGDEYQDFEDFLASRSDQEPFCFWFGSLDPHRTYDEGSGLQSGIQQGAIELNPSFPDSPEVRGDVADYYFEVQRFDREVGKILSRIQAMGELENTIVVVTSDNGMPFPRCKGNLYDGGDRVPLAIRWGQKLERGHVSEHFVSLTDLAPTFLTAAGLDPPEVMTGRRLREVVGRGDADAETPDRSFVLFGKERHVPSQEGDDGGGTPMRGLRTSDYLYIRNYRPDRWPAGTPNWKQAYFPGSWYGDVDNGPTKSYMIESRDRDQLHLELFNLAFARRPGEELYDLKSDPAQQKNLASDSVYEGIKKELSDRLERALLESDDPRVTGAEIDFDTFPYYGGSPLHPTLAEAELVQRESIDSPPSTTRKKQ
ncbi:MAG: sulfatase [Acidobacteriota bacterium]|nr:MAG: sulfatase [Acidobacteriota bacterium]